MNHTIAAGVRIREIVADLKKSVTEGPLRSKVKLCKRHYARLTGIIKHQAICRDLDVIRVEAQAAKKPSWADFDSGILYD